MPPFNSSSFQFDGLNGVYCIVLSLMFMFCLSMSIVYQFYWLTIVGTLLMLQAGSCTAKLLGRGRSLFTERIEENRCDVPIPKKVG